MTEAFTPGPWVLEIEGGWKMVRSTHLDAEGHSLPVADLYHGGYNLSHLGYSSEATARLIASAPSLLEACEALLATHKQGRGQCCAAADKAIDAISQARGAL